MPDRVKTGVEMEEKIRKWLESQGYPLEMRVAREFQKRRFRVQQSEYYRDPETKLLREIDIVSDVQTTTGEFLLRVTFVLECKTSSEKPWVLFTAHSRIADPARVAQRAASHLGHRLLDALADREDIQRLPMFTVHERPAYGMTQAFSTGVDRTYEAAMSVAKAAAARAEKASDSRQFKACEIILPVIVVGAELVECFLDDASEVHVSRTPWGTLLWRNPLVGMPHTIIHVVAAAEVPAFADSALESARQFLEVAEREIPRLGTSGRRAT